MNFSDFEYADEMLSDYGGMVCSFSDSNGAENSVLSHLTINTVKNMNSYKKKIVSHSYDDTYSFSMEICKNDNNEERYFSEFDAMKIINWLGRNEYLKFKPIYDDGSFYDVCYYGLFDVDIIKMSNGMVGISATFQSNSPFGFGEPVEYIADITESNNQITIYDDSNADMILCPKISFTCSKAGDLSINNSYDNRTTVIKNCKVNETIYIDCENELIESSLSHDNLANDFNYIYQNITCKYGGCENTFTFLLPGKLELTYEPLRKVGLI